MNTLKNIHLVLFIFSFGINCLFAQESITTSKGLLVFPHKFRLIKNYVEGDLRVNNNQFQFDPLNNKNGLPKIKIPLNEIDTVLDLCATSFKVKTINGKTILFYIKNKKEFILFLRESIALERMGIRLIENNQIDSITTPFPEALEIIESSLTIFTRGSTIKTPKTFNGKFKLEKEKIIFSYKENDYTFSEFTLNLNNIKKLKNRHCNKKFIIIETKGTRYRFKSENKDAIIDHINGKSN